MTRAERHAQVKALKETGLTFKQIAARLGLGFSTVTGVYYDPTGEKERERKDRRHGTCLDCGADTRNGGSRNVPARCWDCSKRFQGTVEHRLRLSAASRGIVWTEDACVRALRKAARRGYLTKKMYDEAYERAPRGSMPSVPTILHRFDRWADALEAAGLRGGGRCKRFDRITREGCLLAVLDCMADVGHPPTVSDYTEWSRRVGGPSQSIVRTRFGGWMPAITAAIADSEQVAV